MKKLLAIWMTAPLMLIAGVLGAQDVQERDRPSLLAAPWAGPSNISAGVAAEVLSGIDSVGHFDRADWDGLIDSFPATRDMPESRRAELGCIQGRQLAVMGDIEYVLCGALLPTPEGIRIDFELWDMEASEKIAFSPLVAGDQEALVDHALTQIRGWSP